MPTSRLKITWSVFLFVASSRLVYTAQPPQVIAYFTEDGVASGHYTVKDLVTSGAAPLLSQLDYAFGRVVRNRCELSNRQIALQQIYGPGKSVGKTADSSHGGGVRGVFHQLQELKRLYPNLKIVISLGGWGGSAGFSSAAEPAHVRDFVRSCIATFIEGPAAGTFDGIDIDWEYPVDGGLSHHGKPEDKRNFTSMLAEFRRQLDAVHPGLLLTAALPAGQEDFQYFELDKISKYLDQVSIMAYDLHWNTEPVTNFHSALFHDPADPSKASEQNHYGDFAVRAFLKAGIPSNKIFLGVPFYGKGYAPVKDANHGLYQSSAGPSNQDGSYRALRALPVTVDRLYYPEVASCTIWLNGNFWSYDCPEAMKAKMDYVRRQHLGGVMFWELSQDTPDSELLHSLSGR